MNRKQLLLLLGILVVLGLAGYMAHLNKQKTLQSSKRGIGEKLMAEFPLNDISQVDIIQSTQQLTLAKSGEIWTVKERGGYPADFTKIKEFLTKIYEIKVAKPVRVPESRLPALELVSPDKGPGTQVDFKDAKDKTLASLLLGAKHMRESSSPSPMGGPSSFPDGRYVMVNQDAASISLVSDALSNVEPRPADWMNKDFLKVEKIKSISVSGTNQAHTWKLARDKEAGDWSLVDAKPGEELDSSKVSSANHLLSSPYFNDVVVNPAPAELGMDKPLVATLETFDDFRYTIKVGKTLAEDNYPLHVSVEATLPDQRTPAEDEKEEDKERLDKEFKDKVDSLKDKLAKEQKFAAWTYKLSKWSIDFLLKERTEFLVEKKEEEKTPPATGSAVKPTTSVTSPPVALPPAAPPPTPPKAKEPAPAAPAPAKPEAPKPAEAPAPSKAVEPAVEKSTEEAKPAAKEAPKPEAPKAPEPPKEAPKPAEPAKEESQPEQPKAPEEPAKEEPKPEEPPSAP